MNKKLKLFNYQEEVMKKSESITSINNWARGLGKTFTLAIIILEEKPESVLYFSRLNGISALKDKFQEILSIDLDKEKSIKYISYMKEKIIIEYHNGKKTTIFDYLRIPIGDNHLFFQYIMFDDVLPLHLNCNTDRVISMVTLNNYNNILSKLYKHGTVITNLDYKVGIANNLIGNNMLEKFKLRNNWFDEFAIMDNPNGQNPSDILEVLNTEIKELTNKIHKARQREEYGTYKNLILAYKEILNLIHEHRKFLNK